MDQVEQYINEVSASQEVQQRKKDVMAAANR